MTRFRLPLVFAYLLFFASGGAGLAYQVCWTRLFTAGLGHEMPATLAVVGAFFCGMALGAGALDRPISASLRPGRWYAVLEIAIGAWGSLTALFIPAINAGVGPAMGVEPTALQQGAMAFGVPLVALLPATAALGATLPAMERFVSGPQDLSGRPGRARGGRSQAPGQDHLRRQQPRHEPGEGRSCPLKVGALSAAQLGNRL